METTSGDDRKQVIRRFDCGHDKRVTMRNLRRYGTGQCADCRMAEAEAAYNAPAAVSARRKAYRDRVAALGPRPKLSDVERQAQRQILGILRTSGSATATELLIWREAVSIFGEADAREVAALLEILGVAATIDQVRGVAPGRTRHGGLYQRVHIARDQWARMVELFPSLAPALS